MAAGAGQSGGGGREGTPEGLADVLASIRALVSAETAARLDAPGAPPADQADADADAGDADANVIMLTAQMRVTPDPAPVRSGEVLAEGLAPGPVRAPGAPILDEEALRGVINTIVREELQGEMGERISRNLRKLIRREIGQMLEDNRKT